MQFLYPPAIFYISLFSFGMFGKLAIAKGNFDAMSFQFNIQVLPIITGAFHSNRSNAIDFKMNANSSKVISVNAKFFYILEWLSYTLPILNKIKSIAGFPTRISNEDLVNEFNDLKLPISTLKKVLKKQFNVSKAKPSKDKSLKSLRFFSVVEIAKEFSNFIIEDALEDPLTSGF